MQTMVELWESEMLMLEELETALDVENYHEVVRRSIRLMYKLGIEHGAIEYVNDKSQEPPRVPHPTRGGS